MLVREAGMFMFGPFKSYAVEGSQIDLNTRFSSLVLLTNKTQTFLL